jgi:hypothetical protein
MSNEVTPEQQAIWDREYREYEKTMARLRAKPVVATPDPWGQRMLKPSDIENYLSPEPQPIRRKRISKQKDSK